MAVTQNLQLKVDLYKNNNQKSDFYGRYYGRAVQTQTLGLRGLAAHIAQHGSIYTPDVIYGVLNKLSTCIPELIAQGVAVKIDGLGIFFPTLQNKLGGVKAPEDWNADEQVEGVHIRFKPDGTDADNLTYKAMKQKCTLTTRYLVETKEITVSGEKTKVNTYISMEDYLKEKKADGGQDGNGSGD